MCPRDLRSCDLCYTRVIGRSGETGGVKELPFSRVFSPNLSTTLVSLTPAFGGMSGVEAAGFVLAAVPIVIECLQLYSEGLNRTAVLFRKRKHVEKLSHALLTQRALLGENLKSVLIESGVEDGHLLLDDPWAFSGIGDVDEKLRHYFGKEAFVAYMYALAESRTIVEEIAKSIEGYGPVSKVSRSAPPTAPCLRSRHLGFHSYHQDRLTFVSWTTAIFWISSS